MLFVKAAKAVIKTYGAPDVLIGHSLGAMANIIAMNESGIKPALQISIAPLIKLKENFIATMDSVETPAPAKEKFFEAFETLFELKASDFNLNDLYKDSPAIKHWVAFDKDDKISPYNYLQEFLNAHPDILTKEYVGLGHERIIKDTGLVGDIVGLVRELSL
jgi:hypothetical protein